MQAVQEADLPDGATAGVTVDGRQVMLHRSGDVVHAIDDLCSHAGALLSRGPVVDCVVTCPLHESRFDLRDGRIVFDLPRERVTDAMIESLYENETVVPHPHPPHEPPERIAVGACF